MDLAEISRLVCSLPRVGTVAPFALGDGRALLAPTYFLVARISLPTDGASFGAVDLSAPGGQREEDWLRLSVPAAAAAHRPRAVVREAWDDAVSEYASVPVWPTEDLGEASHSENVSQSQVVRTHTTDEASTLTAPAPGTVFERWEDVPDGAVLEDEEGDIGVARGGRHRWARLRGDWDEPASFWFENDDDAGTSYPLRLVGVLPASATVEQIRALVEERGRCAAPDSIEVAEVPEVDAVPAPKAAAAQGVRLGTTGAAARPLQIGDHVRAKVLRGSAKSDEVSRIQNKTSDGLWYVCGWGFFTGDELERIE